MKPTPNQIEHMIVCDNKRAFFDWMRSYTACGTHVHNEYHNLDHCQMVANNAAGCWRHSNLDAPEIPMELIVAGYLHDYNHSGGRESDPQNITEAVSKWHYMHKHPMLQEVDYAIVSALIQITEFHEGRFTYKPDDIAPAKKNGMDIVFMAKCLRDADLMTIYSKDAIGSLFGLADEINRSLELAGKDRMTLDQFVVNNRKFLTDAEMFTPYGQTIKDRYLNYYLDLFEHQVEAFKKVSVE